MSDGLSRLIPASHFEVNVQFAAQQTTHEFYQEVQSRQAHADHCRWYAQAAAQHRQELAQMQGEISPLRWFHRR